MHLTLWMHHTSNHMRGAYILSWRFEPISLILRSLQYIFSNIVGIFVILAVSGYLFGMMFGVLNKDTEQAITILPLAVIPILIFGGLVVNTNDIPVYSSWLQYLSPMRHAFMIVFQNQLKSSEFDLYRPLDIANLYGLNGDTRVALGCLVGLLGAYFFLSIIFLLIIKKKIWSWICIFLHLFIINCVINTYFIMQTNE